MTAWFGICYLLFGVWFSFVVYLRFGKSYTTSSCRIPQGGNAARVYGCSGAM